MLNFHRVNCLFKLRHSNKCQERTTLIIPDDFALRNPSQEVRLTLLKLPEKLWKKKWDHYIAVT